MSPFAADSRTVELQVLSSKQRLEIAMLLCEGMPFEQVVVELDVDRAAARTAALAMGYPDLAKVRSARDQWAQVVDDELPDRNGVDSASQSRSIRSAATASREDSAAAGLRFEDVPVRDLLPDPNNPRDDDDDDVADLAASIEQTGLLQPIVARLANGTAVVVAGHRRLRAVRRLGWDTVPVIIRREMTGDEVLAAMLVENSQRKDLDPIQEARGIQQLMRAAGIATAADAAARVGRGQTWVSGRLALLSLSAEDQQKVRRGQMTLVEATHRARVESGRVRREGYTGSPHFSNAHELSHMARARCVRLKHKARGRNSVGKVACGECWEAVIRANERETLGLAAADDGVCPTCSRKMS